MIISTRKHTWKDEVNIADKGLRRKTEVGYRFSNNREFTDKVSKNKDYGTN